jgi:hypothetical protein
MHDERNHVEENDMKNSKEKQVVPTFPGTITLIIIMFFLTWGILILGKVLSSYIWQSGIVLMFLSIITQVVFIILASQLNNAFAYHLLYGLSIFPALVFMMDGGIRLALSALGSKAWLVVAGTLIACVITIWSVSLNSKEKLYNALDKNKESGRLSPDGTVWDLSKKLHYQPGGDQRAINQRKIWRIISPLLPAVGFAFARNIPIDFIDLFGTYFTFLMVILLVQAYSNQVGIALYIKDLSHDVGSNIHLW